MKRFFLVALALIASCLTGCTTTTASMYTGLAAQAESGIKLFDDNTLHTVQTVLCGQPYAAIQRHPELQPGVIALCGGLANASSLDANQLTMLMQVLGGAGLRLQAAPAATPASGAGK